MTKNEVIKDMKNFVGGSFITRQKICIFLGIEDPHNVDKYICGLDRISKKYYYINDVVDALLEQR